MSELQKKKKVAKEEKQLSLMDCSEDESFLKKRKTINEANQSIQLESSDDERKSKKNKIQRIYDTNFKRKNKTGNNQKKVKIEKYEDDDYILSFQYNELIVNTIKEIDSENRDYNKKNKTWIIYDKNSMKKLQQKFESHGIKYKFV